MLSRVAGEGADLEYGDFVDGTNVLSLTNEEKDMLKMAKEEFARTIVLINSTNAMECDFLNDPEYGVDAALWIGYTGLRPECRGRYSGRQCEPQRPSGGHLLLRQHHRTRSGGLLCKPVHQL